ncbi:hypothetical protein LHJ74_03780 [Streptomyces sp. N2-109]|uniref:Lipoprotein n=1 Tax=Streptomyces gossypii TaxID=2883101 RepID=A0ABT2JMF7_9ACTN|nr:hypothetical protein [Streptomyces gossypii]MCT2589064.1 hypothetical protein [Streptomyces gossypii]
MPNLTTAGRTRRAAAGALLAALTVLAAAGCGDSDDDSGDDAKPAASGSADASPKPKPKSSPAPTAADGTDTAACTDGNCEIAVSKPVTINLDVFEGPAKLALTKVGKDEIGYKVTLGTKNNGSETSSETSGPGTGCTATIYQGGSSGSCGPAGEPPAKEKGTVGVHLLSGADGTAILRLVSG